MFTITSVPKSLLMVPPGALVGSVGPKTVSYLSQQHHLLDK